MGNCIFAQDAPERSKNNVKIVKVFANWNGIFESLIHIDFDPSIILEVNPIKYIKP